MRERERERERDFKCHALSPSTTYGTKGNINSCIVLVVGKWFSRKVINHVESAHCS